MGSFNTTCFASQQTIAPGDGCYVFPVLQQSGYRPVELVRGEQTLALYGITSSTCYSNAFWRQAGPMLEAVYSDYGRVTLADSRRNRYGLYAHLRFLLASAPRVLPGENQYHDKPFDLPAFIDAQAPITRDKLKGKVENGDEGGVDDGASAWSQAVKCWDYAWEAASEHRLFASNSFGVLRPLQYAIVHRVAYEELLKLASKLLDFEGNPLEPAAFFDRACAAAEAACTVYADEGERRGWTFSAAFRDCLVQLGGSGCARYPGESQLVSFLCHAYALGHLSKDQFFENVRPVLDELSVTAGLELMNLKVQPMVYAGQDYSNELGRTYADFIARTSKRVSDGRYSGDEL